MNLPLSAQIEAILFWKGEPITHKKLCEILKQSPADVEVALAELEKGLGGRGLVLVKRDDEFMLGTSPEMGSLIEQLTKDELQESSPGA